MAPPPLTSSWTRAWCRQCLILVGLRFWVYKALLDPLIIPINFYYSNGDGVSPWIFQKGTAGVLSRPPVPLHANTTGNEILAPPPLGWRPREVGPPCCANDFISTQMSHLSCQDLYLHSSNAAVHSMTLQILHQSYKSLTVWNAKYEHFMEYAHLIIESAEITHVSVTKLFNKKKGLLCNYTVIIGIFSIRRLIYIYKVKSGLCN